MLRDFVETYFDGAVLARLEALISAMSDSEVEVTFDAIGRESFEFTGEFIKSVDLLIYACQEDIPYNSPEGYEQVIAALQYPDLDQMTVSSVASLYADCTLFDQLPETGFHEPVTADVPTLAFGSAWDVQTAQSWAANAAATLTNAQSFLIHEAGHGALIFQKCVADMAVAFFNDPARRFDDRCTEATKLKNYHIASWVGVEAEADDGGENAGTDDVTEEQANSITPEQLGLTPQAVTFDETGSAIIHGRVVGADVLSYVFEGSEGELLEIAFEASTPSANFNLLHYGDPEAVFSTWSGENAYSGTLDRNGRYEIRVYLLGQAKETGSADFELTIKLGAD